MARFNVTQTSFASGELSPMLKGRDDTTQYRNGCESLINFDVQQTGGVHKREGLTRNTLWTHAESACRIFPFFNPSTSTEYVIKAYVSGASAITFVLSRVLLGTAASATLPVTVNGDASAILSFIRTVQVGRLAIITLGGYASPVVFDFNYAGSPTFMSFDFYTIGSGLREPFSSENTTTNYISIDNAATGVGRVITASTNLFSSLDEGRFIRASVGTTEGLAYITGYTSPTQVTVTVIVAFGGTTITTRWSVSKWLGGNFPVDVAYYQGRICFLTADGNVQCSRRGDIFNFMSRPLLQDSTTDVSGLNFYGDPNKNNGWPFNFDAGTDRSGRGTWILGGTQLAVATSTTISLYDGGDSDFGSNTPRNVFTAAISTSFTIKAVLLENAIIFPTIAGKLMLLRDNNGFSLQDISSLNYEIFSSITGIVYLENHRTILVTQLNGGNTEVIKGVLTSEGISFSRLAIGDREDFPCSIISSVDAFSTNYGLILYTLDGGSNYYLANYIPTYKNNEGIPSVYVDLGALAGHVGGIVTTTFPENSVVIAYDSTSNKYYERTVNASGEIDLSDVVDPPISYYVGLKYTSTLKTMPLSIPTEIGTSNGAIKRIDTAEVLVYNSKLFKVGSTAARMEADRSSTLFSGRKKIVFPSDPDADQQVLITSEEPFPCSILAISCKGKANI